MPSQEDLRFATRYESHYGNRVFRCYANRPASVMAMLEAAIESAADEEALVCDVKRLSYLQLGRNVDTLAANLTAFGVQAGDRVALLLGNGPEFLIVLFAALRLGAIAVPLNTREQRSGLEYSLDDCTASVLVYDAELADKVPAAESIPAVRHRFVVGGADRQATPFADLLKPAEAALPPVAADEEDTTVILYTSGTTGRPKGVELTHLGIVHSTMHFEQAMRLR